VLVAGTCMVSACRSRSAQKMLSFPGLKWAMSPTRTEAFLCHACGQITSSALFGHAGACKLMVAVTLHCPVHRAPFASHAAACAT
jgi:hypothetical protein